MKLKLLFVCVLVMSLCAMCAAQTAFSPLDGLSTLRDFRAMRSSSADPNLEGNGDARGIAPGATLTIGELEGPGKIAHIWFTIADSERAYGKLLVLRMYWDGEKEPSVETPINDFFCEGHGMDMYVNSLPIRVTSDGRGRNCYWSMPFGKSAKITVTNEGQKRCDAFYYYIDWQKMRSLPKNTAYFHAQYRQEFPCVKGQDYLILDAEGRGHYVGCNLSIRQHEPGWWGEGDDRFCIDGEQTPSLSGTGSEDYFCDGWGIRKLDGLYYGFPLSENFDYLGKHTCYRFHIQDPVPFTKSLKMVIEHKGSGQRADGTWDGYRERFDDFSSVAYWYQTEPHKVFAPLPPAKDRLYPSILIEGESMLDAAQATAEKAIRQDLGGWSGNGQFFWTPQSAPASVTTKFSVPEAGKYVVTLQYTKSFDYGVYQAFLDGKSVGSVVDLYSPNVERLTVSWGIRELTAGEHELKFETTKNNPASKGYYFGLDTIELVPVR